MSKKLIQLSEILFEDNHLLVVNKKAGDLVQGDKTGDEPLVEKLKKYIKVTYNKPGEVFLGVVHRLDRPTSGVVVFAKTSKALSRLNEQFAKKETVKTYWAIVKKLPEPPQDTLTHYLKKTEANNTSKAYTKEVSGSKIAILHYDVIKKLSNYFLLEIQLETGRHHQIRAQLSSIGCPIKGDLKYGAKRSNPDGSIGLHARKLQIIHPVLKTEMTFVAPLPEDPIWQACL
ncbi:MAG: RluA family pseudouridine synthase [Bacteroidetes bacterium]|nr:RluA family pseudouridine synthase [Bacteroidota bacterium]